MSATLAGTVFGSMLDGLGADKRSLRDRATDPSVLDRIRADPANVMHLVAMEPDPWQEEVLRSTARQVLMLCSRQTDKTQTAALALFREAKRERNESHRQDDRAGWLGKCGAARDRPAIGIYRFNVHGRSPMARILTFSASFLYSQPSL
jgi:hypothetical protein